MALHGVSSGELEIKSPADMFFKAFTDDVNGPFDKTAEDNTVTTDREKRTVTMVMSGCLISESYKTVKAIVTVTPKKHGSGGNVVWTVEFEKIRRDIKEPHFIIETLINYLKETDQDLRL
ncbi:unnamed protein product [Microthlaspi erraticum]|uniref:Bet v I/Major latex protein domain-containing protein n=1 Tax=Microthlaspi erraticum TaxID=1685480 RepID=A0A6D2JAN2_9BRAS|nr:unnamed protein product [Microthlaspi erraticum]